VCGIVPIDVPEHFGVRLNRQLLELVGDFRSGLFGLNESLHQSVGIESILSPLSEVSGSDDENPARLHQLAGPFQVSFPRLCI
jgi:hypothetical protein